MTAANAHAVITGGAQQIGASLPAATVHAVLWITGAAVLLTVYNVGYRIWRSSITHRTDHHRAPEPMFFEGSHVIDRAGRAAILRRAREEDRLEAEADAMAEEYKRQEGNGA